MLKLYILFFWKRSPLDIFINAFLPPPSRFQILDATSVPSMSCIDSSQQLCHSGAPAQNASCTRDSIAPFYFISALLHAVILYMRHPSASIFSSTCTALESEFSLIFTSIFFFPCAPVERQFSMATLAVDSQAVTRRRSQLLGEYIRIAISSYCQITASICPQLPFSSEFILQILLNSFCKFFFAQAVSQSLARTFPIYRICLPVSLGATCFPRLPDLEPSIAHHSFSFQIFVWFTQIVFFGSF